MGKTKCRITRNCASTSVPRSYIRRLRLTAPTFIPAVKNAMCGRLETSHVKHYMLAVKRRKIKELSQKERSAKARVERDQKRRKEVKAKADERVSKERLYKERAAKESSHKAASRERAWKSTRLHSGQCCLFLYGCSNCCDKCPYG